MKDPAIAEDLVQETFLSALRSWENFQGRSSFRTCLVAILKYKIVDHIRKGVKEKVFENVDSLTEEMQANFDDRGEIKAEKMGFKSSKTF